VELSRHITQQFSIVTNIRLANIYDLADEADAIVIGYSSENRQPSRVVVYKISHNHVDIKWDSSTVASLQKEKAFEVAGGLGTGVSVTDDDYRVFIRGCASHQCSDGIMGFFTYDGRSGKSSEATVTTKTLNPNSSVIDHYDVKFAGSEDESNVSYLKHLICADGGVTEESKLPFACISPAK
jgi:hypothetical protein